MPDIVAEDVVAIVQRYAVDHYGADAARAALDADDDLAGFGLDSIDLVCVAGLCEDRYAIPVDPSIFISAHTIREAIAQIEFGTAETDIDDVIVGA